jgi:sterol 3beta-glucosyltransferase
VRSFAKEINCDLRVTILTIGFTGDIYPCISLALELKKAGHQASIATHSDFESIIGRYKLDFFPIKGNIRETLQAEQAELWLKSNNNPLRYARGIACMITPQIHQAMIGFLNASQNAELLVLFGYSILPGFQIAEKLQIPFVQVYPVPIHPTREFPCFLSPYRFNLRGVFNRLSYTAIWDFVWYLFRPMINQVREEILGLSRLPLASPLQNLITQHAPTLYAFSPLLVPKPADWGDWLHVTGYWFLDSERTWKPPDKLVDFLCSGPPPIYIGFGSMIDRDPEEMTSLVVNALKKAQKRGILATGWGGAINNGNLSDDVFVVNDVPHEWLFPQVEAVVHHGGLGTVSNAIRAGVPSIVVPFLADQFFWGQQVFSRGVGSRPIPRNNLSIELLANAIINVTTHQTMNRNLAALSKRMRAENGSSNAAHILNQLLIKGLQPPAL